MTGKGSIKVDGLREFADRLQTCYRALVAMHCLMEIETQGNLLRIVSKLPGYLQARWRSKVADIKENDNRLPTLVDLVKFVERAALEATDPVFGTVKRQDWQQESRQSTFTTTIAEQERCHICSGNHKIEECKSLKEQSLEERLSRIKKCGLCFNCLKRGHPAQNCQSKERCKAPNCGKKHNIVLHQEAWGQTSAGGGPQDQEKNETPEVAMSNGYIDNSATRIALPIVAVKVRAPGSKTCVKTYALLDSGSTNTFCSQELLNDLGIKGRNEQVSLTTLERANSSVTMSVTALEVMDIRGEESLHLPAVYTKGHLPISQEHIATHKDALCWPHLKGIDIPIVGTEKVKLLIGQDMPEALIPINVIRRGEGEPWAARTLLGWSVHGPIGGSGTRNGEVSQFMSAVGITSKKQEKKDCSGKQQQEEAINQKKEAAQGSNDSSHTDCKDNKGPREQDKLVTKEKAHDKASQTDEVIPRCQEKITEVRRMNEKSIEEPISSAEVTSATKELVDIERRILKDKETRKEMTDLRAMTGMHLGRALAPFTHSVKPWRIF